MLTNKERKLLRNEIGKIQAQFLPEDDKFLDRESPGPGFHKHDEDNVFGMHRHELGGSVDGAHTHTPQNPEGQHSHGKNEGMALIDGSHYHEKNDGLGYHHHNDEDIQTIVPTKQPLIET